jgi:hypothetical protein
MPTFTDVIGYLKPAGGVIGSQIHLSSIGIVSRSSNTFVMQSQNQMRIIQRLLFRKSKGSLNSKK